MTQDWEAMLDAGFTVLLGHPPGAFDPAGEYGLYYRNALVNQDMFDQLSDAGSLAGMVLPGADGSRPQALSVCLGLDWGLDLARSEFEFELVELPQLRQALAEVPDEVFRDRHRTTIAGADLAATLTAHGLAPADISAGVAEETVTMTMTLRIVTDGTLDHAVRTATRTGAGPDGLRPDAAEAALLPSAAAVFTDYGTEAETAAVRDRILATVEDPRLRAHLWSPYLDMPWARAADGSLAGANPLVRWTSPADGAEPVFAVAWDLSYYGEISLAIIQESGNPPKS